MVVNNIDDDGVECGGLDADIDLAELPMEELEDNKLPWSTITAASWCRQSMRPKDKAPLSNQ